MRRRRGMMLADAAIALALVATLATVLVVLTSRHSRASRELAATRAALRLAEAALADMQAGKPPPQGLQVRRLTTPSGAAGVWVEATASIDGQPATLIGLVPEPAAPPAGGRQP